ncbi:Agamous-like MADS-box protein AGL61 [Platanthera guangdongensis]|uniref:Agamous-like MADS-box protein AGL61 n=1 Tax=Platanthera guangdongensis TaxID=2320717 RepID=A0ABR2LEN0_9ASPA
MSPNKETNRRRGKGRKKIEIKPIQNARSRKVCFSKRRQGLFTKANELCILCGTEVAILFFSPAGKPFTYGHPSMENVVARFLMNDGAAVPSREIPAAAADHCDEIKSNLTYWMDCLETERRRRSQLEAALKDPWPISKPFWWDADPSSLSMQELIEYQNILLQQQHNVAQAEKTLCFPVPAADLEMGNEFADVRPILDCIPGGAAQFEDEDLMSLLQQQAPMPSLDDYLCGFGI